MDVSVEIRALNNRYLKISTKCIEPYNVLEPEIEKQIRRTIRRGTVQVVLRVQRESTPEDFRLNQTAIQSYLEQLQSFHGNQAVDVSLSDVLALPGVVSESDSAKYDPMNDWPVVRKALGESLEQLQAMRIEEGREMATGLLENCAAIRKDLDRIAERAPTVVDSYRERLQDRVQALLSELDLDVNQADLIKEVAIFAERSDITEEIVRLRSHLDQFTQLIDAPESSGRKLEFLSQEMFREANTIGAKASDVEISRHTVEMKGAVEKIREIIQNIE